MQKVECDGLRSWADSARYLKAQHYYPEIAMLSLFGPRNAVRAAWARLSAKTRHSSSIQIGETHAHLTEGIKYVTIQTPMTRQMLHLVMIHPAATHQYTPFAERFIQIGPEPEVRFFARLNRMCPIPFRPAWREQLWAAGREADLITALPGHGMPGYLIEATDK